MVLRAYSFLRALFTPTSVFIVGDAPKECLRTGGGGSKMAENLRTSFMDGPLLFDEAICGLKNNMCPKQNSQILIVLWL